MKSVKTLCPYCGVGCGLEVVHNPSETSGAIVDNWKVRGDRTHPSSQGMVCVKGATIIESIDRGRLLYPMFRESLDQPFRRISWEEALGRIVGEIQRVRADYGADSICMYGSGQFLTEDYYTAQKLIKGCLGTNNFDANSRLCMSSAVSGYKLSLGSDGPPACYEDLELTDCAFFVGSNAAECHPIVFNRFLKYRKRNPQVKLVVIDPRQTPTAETADLHLGITPGSDVDLFHAIAYLLIQWGQLNRDFIKNHTNNFAEYVALIQQYPPEDVAPRCGISVAQIEQAARYWADSQRVLSLWSMGLNQSSEGTAKVQSLINLHLLTGQIGKPGAGPFSLTGQPNAMGGREAGGLAHLLPGYRSVTSAQDRSDLEQFWGLPPGQISPQVGRSVWEMITGLEEGSVQLLWIAATNPLVSLPDLERTRQALAKSPFTIYQEAYYPTETADYAHLLLPATQWSEKTGVMTNSERRVTYCQAFHTPAGEAREDWAVFAEVGRRLGYEAQFPFTSVADVYAEFAQLTAGRVCDVSGLSHEILAQSGPQQWPFPQGSEPTSTAKRLYLDDHFPTANGRANFAPVHPRGLAEPPDLDYPFVLTTGRLYGHWHTQTRTGRIPKIQQMHPEPFLEVHPRDGQKLGVSEGEWVRVESRRGACRLQVKVTKAIAPGTVFVPMHWGSLWAQGAEVNNLTHPAACPISQQPELKACGVKIIVEGN
ncbi:nitrate reductase [Spirulina subsalsa FACHB-351]|uniref:Nitrate reductase n=2 Tax=Spirulina subsalsa TaxID=54311 RepID=A0ABT3L731_9CYAN|nr:nitrate reductase [Spirulina subsalsa FACHB-351]